MSRRALRALGVPILAAGMVGSTFAPVGGTLRWSAPYVAGATAYALAVSPDGTRVYATGCNGLFAPCGDKFMTVAHDAATGKVIWSATYAGSDEDPDTAYAIGVSPDGATVYVTGAGSLNELYATVAYDAATGAQLWEARYKSGSYPCCLQVSPDGARIYVTGTSTSPNFLNAFGTVAYDAATGAELWDAWYLGGTSLNHAHGLAVGPDGARVFVTGESYGSYYNDYATVAYDAITGEQLWEARFNDPDKGGDTAYAVAASPDGSAVFVTGCLGDFDSCVLADFGTVAYDASSGAQLWVASYDGPVHGYDVGLDVATSPDGSVVYANGTSDQLTSQDLATVAYDSQTGAQLWLATYDGPTNEAEYDCCIAVSPDGASVAMLGTSLQFGKDQFATVSIDALTGQIRWASLAKGGHRTYNFPQDVVFSPDSQSVYVTGSTQDRWGYYDFLTLAYRA